MKPSGIAALLKLSIVALFAATFLTSCKTYVTSGFEYNIGQIGVDISQHNTEYQYISDSIFEGPVNKQLDEFDALFYNSLRDKILARGYLLNGNPTYQNLKLKDCLIDFNLGNPEPVINYGDTFLIHPIQTLLICKEADNPDKLFYSAFDYRNDYQVLPLTPEGNLPTQAALDSAYWQKTTKWAYREVPNSTATTQYIATRLSNKTMERIDTLNYRRFSRNYPDLAAQSHKTRASDNLANNVLSVILISAVLLAVFLIPG